MRASEISPKNPNDRLGVEYHMDEASYRGNIGFMEMAKFFRIATDEQKETFKHLVTQGQKTLAWQLVQDTVGVKLQGKEFGTG